MGSPKSAPNRRIALALRFVCPDPPPATPRAHVRQLPKPRPHQAPQHLQRLGILTGFPNHVKPADRTAAINAEQRGIFAPKFAEKPEWAAKIGSQTSRIKKWRHIPPLPPNSIVIPVKACYLSGIKKGGLKKRLLLPVTAFHRSEMKRGVAGAGAEGLLNPRI